MITQPTASRILEVLQEELMANVIPAVSDPQVVASLQMMHHILGTLAVRAEHEIAWLVEETTDLEVLGVQLVEARPDAAGVAAAVAALRANPAASLRLSDVAARYSLASEILSCALEVAPEGSALRRQAEARLDSRLEHEVSIIGEFQLVGRS
ncbi:MAG TPA: hypothetical protein VG298_10465 [Acidimicrobiales bacterium]|nr:hypothetical protein [Acidimicrobiales bacterium]